MYTTDIYLYGNYDWICENILSTHLTYQQTNFVMVDSFAIVFYVVAKYSVGLCIKNFRWQFYTMIKSYKVSNFKNGSMHEKVPFRKSNHN